MRHVGGSALSGEDLDDAYNEYLWGEESPRAFARSKRVDGAKGDSSKHLEVQVGIAVDLRAWR
jgi:hypothetical protein